MLKLSDNQSEERLDAFNVLLKEVIVISKVAECPQEVIQDL